ncbi:MAG: Gfo/Idh/MocA family oxidoreductase [Ilumatobacteraceae bacterium]
MSDLGVTVIGAGIMGANHARVVTQLRGAHLVGVVDPDIERARQLVGTSGATAAEDIGELIEATDLAVIAVPTALHFDLARRLIDANIAVLVEKPIAASHAEATDLVGLAAESNVLLAVGHVERFNAAVAELPNLIEDPIHVRAVRVSPYSPRISDGVVHDLMIHDIDIVLSLFGPDVDIAEVGGTGRILHGPSEDLANAHISLSNGVTAAFETSRLGQQKVRQIEITQRDSVIVADLLRQDVTIHRMSRHEYLADDGVRYRQSSVVEIPFLDQRGEPLLRELQDVVDSVAEGRAPRVDGTAGARALHVADLISASLVRS